MITAEYSYQMKLPRKMGPILQCSVNTYMFFALYWQPCLAYTEFLWVACFVRPIFSSQSRFALILYVMRLHRLNKYKNGCNCTTIHLQLIIVIYIQV